MVPGRFLFFVPPNTKQINPTLNTYEPWRVTINVAVRLMNIRECFLFKHALINMIQP